MNNRIIKIATRGSALAMWQARQVQKLVEQQGYKTQIIEVETSGDAHLTQPAYAFGITGIFTKQLDISLLNNETDIAVHSLKDVPTELAEGLKLAATLERGAVEDVILLKNKDILNNFSGVAKIFSGSIRRKSQWHAKYPNHEILPIRGNVQTRLQKFYDDATIDGIIFAKAGLERLGLLNENVLELNWMTPAPAQGIVGVVCRQYDLESNALCEKINNQKSFIEAEIERSFLNSLMGGCSVPIGALARVEGNKVHFQGVMFDYDGKKSFKIDENFNFTDTKKLGSQAAKKLLEQKGASELINKIRAKKF